MKRLIWLLLGCLLAVASGAGLVLWLSPGARTEAYFAGYRAWRRYYPWEKGENFPLRLKPLFEPFLPVLRKVPPGVVLRLDPEDLVARIILEQGDWEPDTWERIRRKLPRGGTFVDVGAHIGVYSLKAARVVGGAGHVYSVEPNPATISVLRANIALNRAGSIQVFPVACSDKEGELTLFAAGGSNTGSTSLNRHVPEREGAGVSAVCRVRARRLDDLLLEAGAARVDVLKIDVEGAELSVLKGADAMLRRYKPLLVIELREEHLQDMGTSVAGIVQFLSSLGYRMVDRADENAFFAH